MVHGLHAGAYRPYQQRKTDHGGGQNRTGQGKYHPDVKGVQKGAEGAIFTEQQQQEVADHHRGQHQRKIDDSLEDRFSREADKDQKVGSTYTKRQAYERGGGGDLQGQADGLNIFW